MLESRIQQDRGKTYKMKTINRLTKPFWIVCLPALFIAGCQGSSAITAVAPTPSALPASPTPAVPPERALTVCMGEEPKSLYLYGGGGLAARTVLEAVYDGPIDSTNYSYTPVILDALPTIENGGAVLKPVAVKQGDKVFDDFGSAALLVPGLKYRPSGCTDSTCVAAYTGGTVMMDQLVVTFRMLPGLLWSDGEPLTADDSVYSYEVSISADTPAPAGMKRAILGTQSYEKVDDRTVRWTGLPGNIDPAYARRYWSPLPRHAWGKMTPAELLTAESSSRTPLGWGPYTIESWNAAVEIVLRRNPNYFRAAEGMPYFDELHIRFIQNDGRLGVSALISGECDLVDQTVRLDDQISEIIDLQKKNTIQAAFTTGTAWEHLDFNLKPASALVPAYYQDVRLRQAVAMCLDREKVVTDALSGLSAVPDTYLPSQHPLYNKDIAKYSFDPGRAGTLLDQIGWKDSDSNAATPRTAAGVSGVKDGTPLIINSAMVYTELRQKVVGILGNGLMECGIGYVATYGDNSMFVTSVDGLIFGRLFETAEFGWMASVEPSCDLYTTAEIPGIDNGYAGTNPTGFSNAEYDQACDLAHRALPGSPAYTQNQYLAQRIFAENLPSIPLYLTVKTAIARMDLTGLLMDPTAASDLWNLESFDKTGK
jgi:peptide/nickel transport system substrate-binding protein